MRGGLLQRVVHGFELDASIRRLLYRQWTRIRLPWAVAGTGIATTLLLLGFQGLELAVLVALLMAVDGVASRRSAHPARSILLDAAVISILIQSFHLPPASFGLPFGYFWVASLLMLVGWTRLVTGAAIGLMYLGVVQTDFLAGAPRPQIQSTVMGVLTILYFLFMLVAIIVVVVRVLQAQRDDLRRAHEDLEAEARLRESFIATVSHEMRTPVTGIVGFAHELVERWDELDREEQRSLVEVIADQGRDVSRIVDDLLTEARDQAGGLSVGLETLDLAVLANSVQAELGIGERASDETLLVTADVVRVRQIVRNLLTNADRYGGPRVWVELAEIGGAGVLSVCDNGSGFGGDDPDRLFGAYERAGTGAAVPDSVGLGLAVARRLAQLMGGDVQYDHRDGETRFSLSLPLAVGGPDGKVPETAPFEQAPTT